MSKQGWEPVRAAGRLLVAVTKVHGRYCRVNLPCYIPLQAGIGCFPPGAALTVDDELNSLDDGVRRLKIEYDVFFGGGSKKPPADLEWRVQSLIKRFSDGRRLTFAQRFKFSAIQQKYAVYNSLWQQKLRIKEEGYRRPQDALLAIQGVREFDEHESSSRSADEPFRIAFSDVDVEQKKVRALYDAMLETRNRLKAKGSAGTLESFQDFVRKKTDQLRAEYGAHAVEYSIEVEKGQVRLKARAQNGNGKQ